MLSFKRITAVPKSIWVIAISGFLINVATSIIFGLSSCFMRSTLGISIGCVGKIQGVVEALSYGVKFTSGIFSDFFRKRKLLMIIGFTLIAISKPIIAFAGSIFVVFLARAIDRIGNGIQSTPRDALIADLSSHEVRGQCFGIRQALTVAGSATGALLAIELMYFTGADYRFIFMLSTIPCVIAFTFLILFVRDPISEEKPTNFMNKIKVMREELKLLKHNYWKLIIIVSVFMLCRYGEAPLILNATERLKLPPQYATTVMICYNGITSLIAYPIGYWSDRIGREKLLIFGFIFIILSNIFLALSENLIGMYLGVAFWGAQIGTTQTMFISLIADYSPIHLRGTALSVFYFVSFVSVLIASHIYDYSLHYGNMATPFFVGIIFGVAALILSLIFFKGSALKLSNVEKV